MELLFLLVLILWLYWRLPVPSIREAFDSFQTLITFMLGMSLLIVLLIVAYKEIIILTS